MEVPMDLSTVFDNDIVRLDLNWLKRLNARKYPVVGNMIDRMGKLSAEAQHLRRTLTTYEKLVDAEDQYLYLLWEPGAKSNVSQMVALLKIGYKHLYLYDRKLQPYQRKPLCILDFYVYTTKQRQGYGHRLFDYMLSREGVDASVIAIDKPSDSLLSFLTKHYGLRDPIWQNTNYVVYPQFFEKTESAPEQAHESFPENNVSPRSQTPVQVSHTESDGIAQASNASLSSAQMAKGRKIVSMDHHHLW